MNNSWGYNVTDRRFKSTRELIHYLVRAAGHDANLLLNVGPHAERQDSARVRRAPAGDRPVAGENGESIYGTRGGPDRAAPWGVTTRKGGGLRARARLAGHDAARSRPSARKCAASTGDGGACALHSAKDSLLLRLPPAALDPIDTIVVLDLER